MREFTVRLSDDLGRELDEEAEAQGVAKADLVREALARMLTGTKYDGRLREQEARIASLEARVAELEARDGAAPAG